jgi:hypothetical protein
MVISIEIPQKLKLELPYDPEISLLREYKSACNRDICIPCL